MVLVGNTITRIVTDDGDARHPTPHLALPPGRLAIVSVVPAVTAQLLAARPDAFVLSRDTVGLDMACTGMGADRLANAVALWRRHGAGVAIDCGTATTLTVVDADGVIRGGSIMPGLGTSRDVLAAKTAQLPEVDLESPAEPVGTTTRSAIQLGLVHGHVGAILHLLARMNPAGGHVVATGGWSGLLAPLLGVEHAPDLTIEGGRLAAATASS